MRILAVETSTAVGGVALLDGGELVTQVSGRVPQRHLEWLAPAIEQALAQAGWRPADVQAAAVSTGPGSWTGLRVGIATVAAWARARRLPVVGISTLHALAAGMDGEGLRCPMVDARRGEIAAALFSGGPLPARLSDDLIGPPGQVLQHVPAGGPVTFAGDGVTRAQQVIAARFGSAARLAPEAQWWPQAAAVGRLGWARLSRGEADDPYLLRPTYVRAPV